MGFLRILGCVVLPLALHAGELESARDRQDRQFLEKQVRDLTAAASKLTKDPAAQFKLAHADSLLAEVALELRDKEAARAAAEDGIHAAERAVSLEPNAAENHRILGTLCGQVIPAQVLLALKYGQCARSSIDRAIQLDPRSAQAYLSRGVGNYYLPASFGGGMEPAIRDFDKAIQLDPSLADAHLWRGIALRKAGRQAEARAAIAKSLELNPNRKWAKEQLAKTPAQ
jgi:tetratricopeptide (TPR) repeat protein